MDIPKYAFVVMEPQAGKELVERWNRDIEEAFREVTERYDFMQMHRSAPDNFSVYARLATCKNKAELSIELLSMSITMFDSFQYEIHETYREYFRDTHWPDRMFEDADTIAVRDILIEFYKIHPEVTIVTMMPLDFEGKFGFVVIPKDMNP